MKLDGLIDKCSARLVINKYKQRICLYYFDTFSLVMRINSIRIILAIAILQNLEVY